MSALFIPFEVAAAVMEALMVAAASAVDREGRACPISIPPDPFGLKPDGFVFYSAVGNALGLIAGQPVGILAPVHQKPPPLFADEKIS